MSLIKKIDVEAHFAERRRMRRASIGLEKKGRSRGFSVPATAPSKANDPGLKEDFSLEQRR